MKINIVITVTAVLLSLLFACSESYEEIGKAKTKISIGKIDKIKFGKYSDVFDSVKFIKLETTNESLIGRIDKMIFHDTSFFIMDQVQSKTVLQFDLKGKFIRKFGSNGRGPGEYDEPNDIAINKFTNEFMILNHNNKKILFYDLDGKFKRETRISVFAKCFAVLDKDLIALYINVDVDPDHKNNLIFINGKGDEISSKFNIKNQDFNGANLHSFSQKETDILISPDYSNIIYAIDDGNLKKKFAIDFGVNTIPKELFKKNKNEFKKELTKYAYLSKYFETSNYLIFDVIYNKIVYSYYYSKKSKLLKYANYYVNDIHGILSGITTTVYDDYVVSYYDPASIDAYKEMFKYPTDIEEMKSEILKGFKAEDANYVKNFLDSCDLSYSKEEIESIQSISSSDNPILLIRKLKSF